MPKYYVLIFFCSLLFVIEGKAQKIFQFHFDTTLRIEQPNFSHLKLIDNRANKGNVGTMLNVRGRVLKIITIEEDFEDAFHRFAKKLLSNANTASDTVVLVLHDFTISFHVPVTTLHFRGTFFAGNEKKYRLLKECDTLYEWVESVKPYKHRADQANIPLLNLLTQVFQLHVDIKDTTYLPEQLVYYNENRKKAFPIYNVHEYKKGIYSTMNDFLNHTPLDTPFVQCDVVRSFDRAVQFCYADANGKKISYIRTAFAVYNGENFYVRSFGKWEKLTKEDGEFFTEKVLSGLKGQNPYGRGLVPAIVNASQSNQWVYYYRVRFDPVHKRYFRVKRLEEKGLNNEAAINFFK